MKQIELTQGFTTLVDDEDYERVSNHSWCILKLKCCYAQTRINKKTITLHRFLLNLTDSKIKVDHIDGDGLNNQKSNLRIATTQQNNFNRKGESSNISGYKGVVFRSKQKRWLAQIRVNKQYFYLGTYDSKEDAAKAYNKAAIKYHGEFARLNEII